MYWNVYYPTDSVFKRSLHSLKSILYLLPHFFKSPIYNVFSYSQIIGKPSSMNHFIYFLHFFSNRKCDLINRGFSGYNSRFCKILLPKLITKGDARDVELVTILLGANDSVDATLCPKQHVPLQEFKDNMKEIVQYFLVWLLISMNIYIRPLSSVQK